MSISVAMAVCNGEKYIEQQLNSIIHNLSRNDEIIISYNSSEDATLEMIEELNQLPHSTGNRDRKELLNTSQG